MDYKKATDELPTELTPVWVRVMGHRPRKMYRIQDARGQVPDIPRWAMAPG